MTLRKPKIETVPAVRVEQARDRSDDFAFHVRNDGADELELIAIQQDVYGADRGLLRRRTVEKGTLIAPGERRRVWGPMPELAPGISLRTLVYTFVFRTRSGELPPLAVRVSPGGPGAWAMSPAC